MQGIIRHQKGLLAMSRPRTMLPVMLASGRAPIVGARIMLPALGAGSYFEGVVRYDFSLAGDPTKRTSATCNAGRGRTSVFLPDHWFFCTLSKR